MESVSIFSSSDLALALKKIEDNCKNRLIKRQYIKVCAGEDAESVLKAEINAGHRYVSHVEYGNQDGENTVLYVFEE